MELIFVDRLNDFSHTCYCGAAVAQHNEIWGRDSSVPELHLTSAECYYARVDYLRCKLI